MGNFINKHFQKNKSVKVRIYQSDHRVKELYLIPKDSKVNYGGKSYFIDKDNLMYEKGRPTYLFKDNDLSPINPLNFKSGIDMTAQGLYTYSESKLARDFINATGGNLNIGVIALIVSFLTLIAIVMIYIGLSDSIDSLREVISGGVING